MAAKEDVEDILVAILAQSMVDGTVRLYPEEAPVYLTYLEAQNPSVQQVHRGSYWKATESLHHGQQA
jgi:hypothetical protein